MAPSADPDLAQRLQEVLGEGYRVEREFHAGGMSRLFIASDLALGRSVVVKVLPPDLAGEVSAARFQREIALTAHFQHPHILPILSAGAGMDDSLLYYVMPLVEGESLGQRLHREVKLPVDEALRLLAEIADALAYAHARGVIHRDVKPANILIADEHATLVDFGVAQAVAEAAFDMRITQTGHFVGTTEYMAPEQLAAVPDLDGRADVFSLGVVIYEALTGRLPFQGETPHQMLARRLTGPPVPVSELRPEVPRRVSDLIARTLSIQPEERLATAAQLRDGLEAALVQKPGVPRRRVAAAGVVLAVTAAAALLWSGRLVADVDDNRVAIAPFEVMQPEHALWREGFVDVLSANLDGAGPLHTVPTSVVMRSWSGRPDLESATDFGRRVGARFVVLGWVMGAGPDSARVSTWLVDVTTGKRGETIDIRDAVERMDRIADTLTLALLRDMGAILPMALVRRASIGSTSLPAIRAFLEGEQHFRRTAWDSARASYLRAIAIDSTFALAHAHVGLTYAWQRFGTDSVARVHALRAGALNRGLAPRESLLIVSDSLRSVAYAYGGDPRFTRHVQRLFATLREASRRYEQDAEVWYRLADAYFHFAIGPGLSVPEEDILATFDRSLALDPAFAPAYIHPVELGFAVGDSARAMRYVRRYIALRPTDVSAAGTLLAARLLGPPGRDSAQVRATFDTASADLLFQAYSAARRARGGHDVAADLLSAMSDGRRADYAPLADPNFARHRLALQLSYRGRFADAMRLAESRRSSVFAEMALAGAVPEAEAQRVFAEWLESDPREPGFRTPLLASAGAWWAQERDTTALREMIRRGRSPAPARPGDAESAAYVAAVGQAYLSLARGDSVEAVRRFGEVPHSACQTCAIPRLIYARLLSARGRTREAAAVLAERPTVLPSAVDVLWALERGRVAERNGDRRSARASYERVVDAWARGDADATSLIEEAREGLERASR
jgi:eukaryotic-like serine/threonine-protein kinase